MTGKLVLTAHCARLRADVLREIYRGDQGGMLDEGTREALQTVLAKLFMGGMTAKEAEREFRALCRHVPPFLTIFDAYMLHSSLAEGQRDGNLTLDWDGWQIDGGDDHGGMAEKSPWSPLSPLSPLSP